MSSYVCKACGGEFDQPEGREEKAQEEAKARYGVDGNHPSMVKVCVDCFNKIRRFEESLVRARSARWN
jgi:hypothetical protein